MKQFLLGAGAMYAAQKTGLLKKVGLGGFAKEVDGVEFYRVNNDVYGNPRYVVHYLEFDQDYKKAHRKALSIGASKYRGKDFGGGFVMQSYSLTNTAKRIKELKKK